MFNSLDINPKTLQAISRDFGYTKMTQVQQQILSQKEDKDLLVRAKTGTGKTLAFLIQALEKIVGIQDSSIKLFILSPTRELASQIGREAEKLSRLHGLKTRIVVGGTNRSESLSKIASGCDILIGTPGRALDLISNEKLVRDRLEGLQVMVFDEADLLLEMGFKRDIERITSYLPPRSTYMFSATLSEEVKAIAENTLRPGYRHVDCVAKNESDTHMKIKQSRLVVPFGSQIYLLQDIILKHQLANPTSKIIVFCTTTAMVGLVGTVLQKINQISTFILHGKLAQNQRARISDQFRQSFKTVMVTSDVSARGVDYPGVGLVIQLGIPTSREQYVHRIGRTGRADTKGESILILSPYEKRFLESLKDLPIREELRFNPSPNAQDKTRAMELNKYIQDIDISDKAKVYSAFLAYYANNMKTNLLRKDTIVLMANELARDLFKRELYVSKSFVEKSGFAKTPGLKILDDRDRDRRAPIMLGGTKFSSLRSANSSRMGSFGKSGVLADKVKRELGTPKKWTL